jgi:glycosyltransferase involved in cell wall biosynthesis
MDQSASRDYSNVAVLVPCYNEAVTIAKVVDDFRRILPGATVWVYDNNSKDGTGDIARAHGARVVLEPRQGKGNVVRQMFRDIDADCYLMVDGDDTYEPEAAPKLVEPILNGSADHVVGDRLSNGTYGEENDRAFHGFGNNLVRWLIKVLYGFEYTDVMTGYRAMSRAFVKTFPVLSPGFEIETELSIHAVDKRWRIVQIPIVYRDRPEGSESKLSTFSDGAKVLGMIATLFKDYKPLPFFSILALISLVICLCIGIPVIAEFQATGLVQRFPSAFLAMAFGILAVLLFCCGLILDTVNKGNRRDWELRVVGEYERSEARAQRGGEAPANAGANA